jgi:hypothetical protein
MLTTADDETFPSASFAIYRPPAILFDGIRDGIDSEQREERQSEQAVAGVGNDRVGVAGKSLRYQDAAG